MDILGPFAAHLEAALRVGGCLGAHELGRATTETNGQITVVLRPKPDFKDGRETLSAPR